MALSTMGLGEYRQRQPGFCRFCEGLVGSIPVSPIRHAELFD